MRDKSFEERCSLLKRDLKVNGDFGLGLKERVVKGTGSKVGGLNSVVRLKDKVEKGLVERKRVRERKESFIRKRGGEGKGVSPSLLHTLQPCFKSIGKGELFFQEGDFESGNRDSGFPLAVGNKGDWLSVKEREELKSINLSVKSDAREGGVSVLEKELEGFLGVFERDQRVKELERRGEERLDCLRERKGG